MCLRQNERFFADAAIGPSMVADALLIEIYALEAYRGNAPPLAWARLGRCAAVS